MHAITETPKYFPEKNGTMLRALAGPMVPFVVFILATLALLTLSRLGLVLWQLDRVLNTEALARILLTGLRFDLILIGQLLILPAMLTPLMSLHRMTHRLWQRALRMVLVACFGFMVFMELATPSFIHQYDARPNILFVEYLKYPLEVGATLWGAYRFELLLAVIVLPAIVIFFWMAMARVASASARYTWWQALLATPLVIVLLFAAARSTLDHRPANPSKAAITSDLMVNDLALNSTYSLLYAIYETKEEKHGGFRYGFMADDVMLETVRNHMNIPAGAFLPGDIPTLHTQLPTVSRVRKPNLVIILEESLGAERVGRLGGLPLTPRLDALANEGIWFENLYATGTRSVRGIEAVITGFPPTASISVVKLPKSQRGFYTVARLLKNEGYKSRFLYGGESHFDNMRRFFVGNGFDEIIDQNDFDNPVHMGSWGVSDEDLFNKLHEVLSKDDGQPSFTLAFSTSNHSPYDYPDNRIELFDADRQTVNNAVKYADHALGGFFDKAKNSSYYENTIFLVIADHNDRVYGSSNVPIEHFRIPGLILGAGISPRVYGNIASQIDMLPTLLSIMGIKSEHPMIGHDLTMNDWSRSDGRAIMQYNNVQAYMSGEDVVILQKDLPPHHYKYSNGTYSEVAHPDNTLIDTALAHALFGPYSYEHSSYRLNE